MVKALVWTRRFISKIAQPHIFPFQNRDASLPGPPLRHSASFEMSVPSPSDAASGEDIPLDVKMSQCQHCHENLKPDQQALV